MNDLIRNCEIHGNTFADVESCVWDGETIFLCVTCRKDIGALTTAEDKKQHEITALREKLHAEKNQVINPYFTFNQSLINSGYTQQMSEGEFPRGALADASDEALSMILTAVWHPLREDAINEVRRRGGLLPIEFRR